MVMTIEDVIGPALINVDLQATDRSGAIEELTRLLAAQGRIAETEPFVAAVLAREEETGGTGMESGIAIPHGKSTSVKHPSIAFGRSSIGIDFGAEDGTKADLIFLIAAPEGADDAHVTLLSRLARRLIHEGFRNSLREARTSEEVFEVIRGEVQL